MGRLSSQNRRTYLFVMALIGTLALGACSNPIDLLKQATQEVMQTADRFLDIETVSPLADETNVNPNGSLLIRFDKAIDPASVSSDSIQVTQMDTDPALPIVYLPMAFPPVYENDGATIRLTPVDFFESGKPYKVILRNLKSKAGNSLKQEYLWKFTTGVGPAGSLTIVSGNAAAQAGFTNTATNKINLTANEYVTRYYVSDTAIADPTTISDGLWNFINGTAAYNSYPIDISQQGTKTVYAYFRGLVGSNLQYSSQRSASTIVDTIVPVVDAGADVTWTNAAQTLSAAVTDTNPHSSLWSSATVSFGSATEQSTTASGTSDGTKTITFTATDKAGNSAADTLVFNWDSTPPAAPSFTNTKHATTSTTVTWDWTPGANGGPYYQYKMGSTGTLQGPSYLVFSYMEPSLADGTYSFYVQQKDAIYDYYSPFAVYSIRVTPVIPYDGQTRVSTTTRLEWRDQSVSSYIVQYKVGRYELFKDCPATTSTYYDLSGLDLNTTYTWRVMYTFKTRVYYLPSETGADFTTSYR